MSSSTLAQLEQPIEKFRTILREITSIKDLHRMLHHQWQVVHTRPQNAGEFWQESVAFLDIADKLTRLSGLNPYGSNERCSYCRQGWSE